MNSNEPQSTELKQITTVGMSKKENTSSKVSDEKSMSQKLPDVNSSQKLYGAKPQKSLLLFAGLFSAVLIGSNFMAVKLISIGVFTIPAAIICYPFVFVIGDVLNEFWGFKTTRYVVILTFIFNAVVLGFLSLVAILPPSDSFLPRDEGFRDIFLSAPRLLVASFAAFVVSGILNGYVFAKIKTATSLPLPVRSAVSSALGVIVDSLIFIFVAFAWDMPWGVLGLAIAGQIIFKLIIAVALGTPMSYLTIRIMRKKGFGK
jgi:uncharacterized integral membrane protein (TIGR00697 family)